MTAARSAVAAVWAGTLAAVVVAAVVVPASERLAVLTLVLAVSVVLAIAVQLAVGEREGFVQRLATTAAGAFGIVVAAGLVLLATA